MLKKILNLFKCVKVCNCSHEFVGKDLQPRDSSNGIVKWPCSKCGKVFEAECGLDILKHGKCVGGW